MPPKRKTRQPRQSKSNTRKKDYRTPSPPPRALIEPLTPTFQQESRLLTSGSYFTFPHGATPTPIVNNSVIPRPASNESHSDSTLSILSSVSPPPPRPIQTPVQRNHNAQQPSTSSYDSSPIFNGVRYENQLSFFADLAMTYADPTMATKLQELAKKEAAERPSVTPGPSNSLRNIHDTPTRISISPPTNTLQIDSGNNLPPGPDYNPPSSFISFTENAEISSSNALHEDGKITSRGVGSNFITSPTTAFSTPAFSTPAITSEDNVFPSPPAKRSRTTTHTEMYELTTAQSSIAVSSESLPSEGVTQVSRSRRGGRRAGGKSGTPRGKQTSEPQNTPKSAKGTRGRSSKRSSFILPTSRVLRSSLVGQNISNSDVTTDVTRSIAEDAKGDSPLLPGPPSTYDEDCLASEAHGIISNTETKTVHTGLQTPGRNSMKLDLPNGITGGQVNATNEIEFDTHVEERLKSHLALSISNDHDEEPDESYTSQEYTAPQEAAPASFISEGSNDDLTLLPRSPKTICAVILENQAASALFSAEKENEPLEAEINTELVLGKVVIAERNVATEETVSGEKRVTAGETATAEQMTAEEETTTAEETAIGEETAIAEESSTTRETATVEETAAEEEASTAQETAIAEEIAAEEETFTAQQTAAAEGTATGEGTVAAEERVTAEEMAIAGETATAEEIAIVEKMATAEEMPIGEEIASTEEMTEVIPAEYNIAVAKEITSVMVEECVIAKELSEESIVAEAGVTEDGASESSDIAAEIEQPVVTRDLLREDLTSRNAQCELVEDGELTEREVSPVLESFEETIEPAENKIETEKNLETGMDGNDVTTNSDMLGDTPLGPEVPYKETEKSKLDGDVRPLVIPLSTESETAPGNFCENDRASLPLLNDSLDISKDVNTTPIPQAPAIDIPHDTSSAPLGSLFNDKVVLEKLELGTTTQSQSSTVIPVSQNEVLSQHEATKGVTGESMEIEATIFHTVDGEIVLNHSAAQTVHNNLALSDVKSEVHEFHEEETANAIVELPVALVLATESHHISMRQFPDNEEPSEKVREAADLRSAEDQAAGNVESTIAPTRVESDGSGYKTSADVAITPEMTVIESTGQLFPSESTAQNANQVVHGIIRGNQELVEGTMPSLQTAEAFPGLSCEVGLTSGDEDADQIESEIVQQDDCGANEMSKTDPLTSASTPGDLCAICKSATFVPGQSNTAASGSLASTPWIQCDGCKEWCHTGCARLTDGAIASIDKYHCAACEPSRGPSTLVRKSMRSKVPIDYEALNDGASVPAQSATNKIYHHYVDKIINNEFPVEVEYFPRIVPHELSLHFFEDGSGFTTPIVIPAHTNPYPRTKSPIFRPSYRDIAMYSGNEDLSEDEWNTTDDEDDEYPLGFDTDALGMGFPHDLTVRKVVELVGPNETVEVIDVKSQQGDSRKWPLSKWIEYFEEPNKTRIYNVISLEVSQSKLGRLIRRPKIVREMDISDQVWPKSKMKEFPNVQYYVLMSVANAYTDWHVDFGGSSVYYRILKGRKTFYFLRPTPENLDAYTKWANLGRDQNWTWLADGKECFRVDLGPGDTMLIPSGWLHAVYTPEDSLVIGGNFLTRLHYKTQFKVHEIERLTHTPQKYRFPRFAKLHWYDAEFLMQEDPMPEQVERHLLAGKAANFRVTKPRGRLGNFSDYVLEGLPDFALFLRRNSLIAQGVITEGLTKQKADAVKAAIPKHSGDGWDFAQRFARWVTWKRNCGEVIPRWAYPDANPSDGVPNPGIKKLSVATMKHIERAKADQERRAQGMVRQGLRNYNSVQQDSPVVSTPGSEIMQRTPRSASRPTSLQKQVSVIRKRKREPEKTSYDRDKLQRALAVVLGEYEHSRDEIRRAIATEVRAHYENVNVRRIGPARSACKPCRDSKTKCLHKDEIRELNAEVLEKYEGLFKEEGLPSAKRKRPQPVTVVDQNNAEDQDQPALENSNRGEDEVVSINAPASSVFKTPKKPKKLAVRSTMASEKSDFVSSGQGPKRRGGKRRACDSCRQLRRKCTHNPLGLPIDQLQKLLNSGGSKNAGNASKKTRQLSSASTKLEVVGSDREDGLDLSDEESNRDESDGTNRNSISVTPTKDDSGTIEADRWAHEVSDLQEQSLENVPGGFQNNHSIASDNGPPTTASDDEVEDDEEIDNFVTPSQSPGLESTSDNAIPNHTKNSVEEDTRSEVVVNSVNTQESEASYVETKDSMKQLLAMDTISAVTGSTSVDICSRKRKLGPITDQDESPKKIQYRTGTESPQSDTLATPGRVRQSSKATPRKAKASISHRQTSASPNAVMLNSAPWQAIKAEEFGLRSRSKSKS